MLLKRAIPEQGQKQERSFKASFRQVTDESEGEDNSRRFELTFSSEEPYDRFFGPEILDHGEGAVDLTRLSEIGCVLFNHERDDVIGRVDKVWIDDGRAHAVIEFDDDEFSERIMRKVQHGSLKGVSVGYMVDNFEEVASGKKSTDGRFTGPCFIARKWTPLEISIVSVPADATVGVGRSLDEESAKQHEASLDAYERQLLYNNNFFTKRR